MKSKFVSALILALLLPFAANASISSDMANPRLSLVAVMQNAVASGMSVADAVGAMIKVESKQTNAIVATAMVVAPDQYQAIIEAAIAAGAKPENVVAAAIMASDGENADKIIAVAVNAAPDSKDAIVAAAVRAAPQTTSGVRAIAGTLIQPNVGRSSGGGAAVTVEDAEGLQDEISDLITNNVVV
ncbi:MAG: hypothetical protein O3C68_10400, partial [Proteobacteria bacterium]|nr:hypothetical protein [Pseudomonadota bacterium]